MQIPTIQPSFIGVSWRGSSFFHSYQGEKEGSGLIYGSVRVEEHVPCFRRGKNEIGTQG